MADMNGKIHKKNGNRGYSTLFPEDWSNEKIKEEVLYALKNAQRTKQNYYKGTSKDGKIKIEFIIKNNKMNAEIIDKFNDYYKYNQRAYSYSC